MAEKVSPQQDSKVRVSPDALRATVQRIFEKVGVPREDASIGADVLVKAGPHGSGKPTGSPTCWTVMWSVTRTGL